jgi:hypothetical protein
MGISKSDFVKNLLKDNKINAQQREKVFHLVARDFVTSDSELKRVSEEINGRKEVSHLIKRIEKIESSLSELKNKEKMLLKPIRLQKKSPEHNPKHVADFMSLFNQRAGLKYLTHDYDEDSVFDVNEFLKAAFRVFEKETKRLNIPPSLWRIVKQFAFDSKQTEWTSISIDYKKDIPLKIGWATPELRNWSKQNHLHPIRNEEYKKIINDFKRITRIESSNLEKLIDAALVTSFGNEIENFKIEKINLSKADFYTHVNFLKIAFNTIFEEIIKRSDSKRKKEITIKYKRDISDDGYHLRKILITHHKSFPTKELEVLLKEWQEKGNMGNIKEKLYGYCHWSVETMIDDVPTKVNILKEKGTPEYEIIKYETEELKEGFTHILTFYYK